MNSSLARGLLPVMLVLVAWNRCPGESAATSVVRLGAGAETGEPRHHGMQRLEPGPWGNLEYFPLLLEPPDWFCRRSSDLRDWTAGTIWRFPGPTESDVADSLREAGLPPDLVVSLIGPSFLTKIDGGEVFEIRPSQEQVLSLTREQRSALYGSLDPEINKDVFVLPYALPAGGIQAVSWLPTGVPPEQIALIDRMTFQRGEANRFSDIALVFRRAESEEERFRILKTLGREESLSVRLLLSESSDLRSLVEYWGGRGRNKEILPILESVLRTSGIDKLDIVHLLPPTPRKLVHTYPSEFGHGIRDQLPDCFWTAYSFFAEDPPDRHLDFVGHVFRERYEPAVLPAQFGDLIMIVDSEKGEWIHACNHIAGDLVYSKNGNSMGRPWVITTLDEVVKSYLKVREVSVTFHRLKPQYRK